MAERRRRPEQKEWWEKGGPVKKAILYFTGTVFFYKAFKFIMEMFSSERQRGRRAPYRGKTDTGSIVKKVLVVVGIVAVGGFLFFQLSTMVYENFFYEMDEVSPGEFVSRGVSSAANATRTAANNLKVGIMTPFWKSQCQRQILPQNPENADLKIRNCVREKQGLPPINDSEEEKEQEWELRSASSYLSAELNTELIEADYMKDVCGSRCGRVETVIRNRGDKPLRIEDIGLSMRGPLMEGNYPIMVYSEKASEQGKKYMLKSFIDGVGRLQDWTNIAGLDEDDLTVLGGETKTVTFLVNLSRHTTFSRNEVVDQLEDYRETVEENTGEDIDINEYCQERGGVYDEEQVLVRDSTAFFEEGRGSENFPEFGNQVCSDHVIDSVENSMDTILGSEQVEPVVNLNYSGTTESVLNLQVWNRDEWGNMAPEEREEFRIENCRTIGTGDTLKQTSEMNPGDVVAFLMYTDCEVLYSEEESGDRMILDIQAKGDSSHIESFRIDSVEDLSGNNQVCDSPIDEDYPADIYSNSRWFRYEEGEWTSPTTACYVDLPETLTSSSLNLGISADFSVSAKTSSAIRLD